MPRSAILPARNANAKDVQSPNGASEASGRATSLPDNPEGRAVVAKLFRALGDPVRLALLEFLASGERNGTECVEHVGLSQGRVSSHLACLVTCGLASVRREGRYAYYSVRDPIVLQLLGAGATLAAKNAESVASCTRVAPA